ncbi:outer membrane beta-barrel protein|uniref:outer membrane beta-barrel protein n=1 Tax=Noviherbaspirillum sp. L7-7A TaxID=2850560 RepID=UPI001C2BF2C7|nr:outer membrane beta-barrel protein [Noviherbaspirillum sp. L7-7A]MBV0880846.1 outer membrane beta-barrel protein [Noviherbaspirillum sp. L7-7A]
MKAKSIISALMLALPALAATSAIAADAAANPSFYVGGNLGKSNFKFKCDDGLSCSEPSVNFKLLAGYQFSPNFAVEGAYANFGTIKASVGDFMAKGRIQSFTLAGLGIIPLSNEAQLFGKIGMHHSRGNFDIGFPGESMSSSGHKTGLLLGAGFQYDFTKNLAGRVEYERLNFGSDTLINDKNNISMFSVGLLYKF